MSVDLTWNIMEPTKNQLAFFLGGDVWSMIKFPTLAKSAKRWANEVEEMEDLGDSFSLGDDVSVESLGVISLSSPTCHLT